MLSPISVRVPHTLFIEAYSGRIGRPIFDRTFRIVLTVRTKFQLILKEGPDVEQD